jgi:5'-nucleotidase
MAALAHRREDRSMNLERCTSFLAAGGDGFTVFNQGTDPLGGAQDIDALVDYFEAAGAASIAVPPGTGS